MSPRMSPAGSPQFEARVALGLKSVLAHAESQIVVDSTRMIEQVKDSHDLILLVDFFVEGKWASPARFTFPF